MADEVQVSFDEDVEISLDKTEQKKKRKTKVVHIKREGGEEVVSCDVYIGRECSRGGWKLKKSKWANPFKEKQYGLEGCIKKYENYVRNNETLMASIEELRGKKLGCFCKPKPCHGDVLIKILNER